MRTRVRASVLVSLATLVACDDTPVTVPAPAEPVVDLREPAALQGLTDRQLLITLLTRVDALEARLDSEARLARALVDTIRNAPQWEALVSLAANAAGVPPADPGGNGGQGGIATDIETLLTSTETLLVRSDSMMDALYNPWAQHSLCFDLAVPFHVGAELMQVGQAEVEGGLGAFVFGNGADVEVRGRTELDLKLGLSVEPAFNYSACWDPGAHRGGGPAGAGFRAASLAGPDQADLESAFNAIGLSPAAVASTLQAGRDLLSGSPGFLDLADLPSSIWTPPAVQNLATEAALRNALRQAGADAVSRLCDTDLYPPEIRDAVAEACAVELPSLQTIVAPVNLAPLQNSVTALCTTFNGLLSESFSIPSFTIPRQQYSFLGISQETFPGATIPGVSISLFGQSPLNCSF